MKKTLTVCLAVILALTFALSAFAGKAPSKENVLNEVNAAIGYITDGISGYTADSAVDYYYIAQSGTKGEEYYPAFLQSVKDNLKANGGKLITAYGENIASYAAVIGIIDTMGGDPTDIESVNLAELFEKCENTAVSGPYIYNIVIPVAAKYCSEEFVKTLCDSFIENYYTMGSGMNYWGFACDNTAMFLSAISQCGLDCYDAYIEDAVKVLDTHKTEGGYFYNSEYGTAANVNSTGLALMAKCAYYGYKGTVTDNISELSDIYSELLTFKGQTAGSFKYEGEESPYSAADALKGLTAFYSILPTEAPNTPDDTTKPDEAPDKPVVNKPSTDKNNSVSDKNPDIPNTDGKNSVLSVVVISIGAVAMTTAFKKNITNSR